MDELTWLQAIQRVLAAEGRAMHYQDITEKVVAQGLRQSLGATPAATVSAQLSSSLKHKGEASPFERVTKGVYRLKGDDSPGRLEVDDLSVDEDPSDSERQEDVGLIQAFGMFWLRDAVDWRSSPAILGRQQIGADIVNFSAQLGVYLLHDGREVTYVGRSIDRPMGQRLFEHTKDRLQARWNRFSWFGLLRVTEEGELVETQATLSIELVAVTLEAVLIEGLEPRQNRRRGDGFNATEYLQAEDPEIHRRQTHQLLDSLKAKL